MHHRRSQGDSKSTNSISNTLASMPPSTSNSATTGRVSIYSVRERVILNKMTRMMGKLAPDTETEVTSSLHQEIPAIRLDGYLTYTLYITLQNFIHFNAIYILLYHGIFWIDTANLHKETIKTSRILDQTQYEQTYFVTLTTDFYAISAKSININLINKHIYLSLVGISSIELINAFLWTIKKKLPYFFQRNQKFKYRLNKILIAIILLINLSFISALIYQTFFTHQLPVLCFSIQLGHFILLILIDKPHLFEESPYNTSKSSTTVNTRKQHRNSTSSSSTSSIVTTVLNRLSYRSSMSNQPRRINLIPDSTTIIPWSRWSSILEEKLEIHECTTMYSQAREEADDIWPIFLRRMILNIYRTLSSFILFDFIPLKTMNSHARSKESQPFFFLILIFTLSTFIAHSAFLFPVKFQTTLHRIATHLGQWRQQANIRTDTIPEWSSECNFYTRGSFVKISSTNRHYIAIQHLNNAANPQSKSHSILYRFFGDPTLFLTIQFICCLVLVCLNLIWIIRERFWEAILIGCFLIFHSSYSTFKIVRDRIIMDFVEEHENNQTSTISKQKKSS